MTERQLFRVGLRLFGLWLAGTGISRMGAGLIALAMAFFSDLEPGLSQPGLVHDYMKTFNCAAYAGAFDGILSLGIGLLVIFTASRITELVHRRDAQPPTAAQ